MRRQKGRFWTRYDKLQQAEPTEVVSNLDGSLYVVLFNANEGPHSHDLRLVYHSLINAGVSDTDISVLEGDGRTQKRFVNKPATMGSLDSVIDSIRKQATANDRLLVYVTNHGNLVNGQCNIESYDGTIWEKDFEQMMQDLPTNFGLFYFAQCYSGGFAERMGYGRNIGMSNTDRENVSQGFYPNRIGAFFTHRLFDFVTDIGTSIERAFERVVSTNMDEAKNRYGNFITVPTSEIPQLRWQNANPSQLYLGSTSPSKK